MQKIKVPKVNNIAILKLIGSDLKGIYTQDRRKGNLTRNI